MRKRLHCSVGSVKLALLMGAALVGPGMLPGCGMFESNGRAKAIPAEYRGLDNQSVAIIVYTAEANTDEFPEARKEISNYVATEMKMNLPTTRLLDIQEVLNWQDDTINWFAMSPKEMGKRFSVDKVLYIEVLKYEARADGSYGDLQGHLRANCKVFDTHAPGTTPVWSGVIDAMWPQYNPVSSNQTSEVAVRSRTLQGFADQLVGRFYDNTHTDIPLKDR